jgi:hypothetical protein
VWPTKQLGGQVRDARCAQQKQHCCNAQNELYRSDHRESNYFSGGHMLQRDAFWSAPTQCFTRAVAQIDPYAQSVFSEAFPVA